MRWKQALSVVTVLSLSAVPCISSAQKAGKVDPAAAAKEKEGRELLAKKEYDAAISELLGAHELSKKPELLYLVAKAYDQSGSDPVGAKTYYEEYLAATNNNPPELAEIQGRLAAIDADLAAKRAAAEAAQNGKLTLEIDRSDAIVELDEKVIGNSPLPGPLTLKANSYTVRVAKPGFKEYLAVHDVEPGEETRVKIALEKEGKTRYGLWVGLAVGVVAAGVGTSIFLFGGDDNNLVPLPGGDLGLQRF
jgi:hypothetical protein